MASPKFSVPAAKDTTRSTLKSKGGGSSIPPAVPAEIPTGVPLSMVVTTVHAAPASPQKTTGKGSTERTSVSTLGHKKKDK